MWPRVPRRIFEAGKGAGNKRALRRLVLAGPPPGLLAYRGDRPVAWCAVGPRDEFVRLRSSRSLAPVDDRPAWAITCLFVAKDARGQGVSVALIDGAARFARRHGARLIEGYPSDPRGGRLPDAFAWTGLPAAFERAGFTEVARRAATRPIVRRELRVSRPRASR